ncbi:VirD4-like conjugal transfer protein, CD1115 family [Oceanobacillus timonensis]|uniref:VirD4-like conjugal transfer protein, CD1115 family n=1 Tax=Oceanobacillus timonensis TaxID=1926285 RepID=UPI0015C44422|nr:type IV secretory system conjugative DNA transfer family protein [Oceanobacillus timonensis]
MRYMRNKYLHQAIALFCTIVFFSILNLIANLIVVNIKDIFQADSFLEAPDINLNLVGFLTTFNELPVIIYLGLGFLSLMGGGMMYYKMRSNFKSLTDSGSKGTSRFTTLKELKQQYRQIPDRKKEFKKGGGVPVSHYKNKIFIDDSPVNNLWIGTTRSGKGEMGMFPLIDIYSRAKEKASMVVNDPKGELYASSVDTLLKRGFHVEVLNLADPMQSMAYQLLQVVIDSYEEGDIQQAELYSKSITDMIYINPNAKDPFWQNNASALCRAVILGLCEKNIPENKGKVTMYNVASTINTLASEVEIDEVTGQQTTGLDKFFESLPENHPAKLQFATVKFSAGAPQTVAGIYANAFEKLNIFTMTPVAKMTSKNSFPMRKIGFGKYLSGKSKPLSRVEVLFPKGVKESVKTNVNGLFKITHDAKLDVGDKVTLKIKKSSIKQILEVTSINAETGEVSYNKLEDEKENEVGIEMHIFEHFTKPTALFMITPDYDKSLHVIASLYVKQLYTELSRIASLRKGGKTIREVIFILDEFGNMPIIDDMGTMITVCLGRNMRFNLVIQAYSQLKQNYDKDWETIDGNCANTIYILTTSNDTAEEISKKIDKKTIESNSRSGDSLSLDKNKTEGTDGRSLLDAGELRRLKEGEMVVIRGIKRQDNDRKKIVPFPIFATGETRMKYRYEYLADDFDTSNSITEIDIPCPHADFDLNSNIYRFKDEDTSDGIKTIGELLDGDNILSIITQTLKKNTDMDDTDVFNLTPEEFKDIMFGLHQQGDLASNTYNVTMDKFNIKMKKLEGEVEHEQATS